MNAGITIPDLDDAALHAQWQARAALWKATPFLRWGWVGCLGRERFSSPVLVRAAGGMALFNQRAGWPGRTWYLNESGDPALDGVFIEHNGALGPLGPVLEAIRDRAWRVKLSGIDDAGLAAVRAAGGIVVGLQSRAAPFATLDQAVPHTTRLSRNARAQLRRSDRSYAAHEPIRAERAETVEEALAWLDRLVALHQATWEARGVTSNFLSAGVQRFHRALIGRGVPDGSVDVLRVTAGAREIGYLLNLRGQGRVHAYQSGFNYADATAHEKPGLSSHHAAIERARLLGDAEYDFLAGDSRYKRSLSTGVRELHWLTWKPRPALFGLEAALRRLLGR